MYPSVAVTLIIAVAYFMAWGVAELIRRNAALLRLVQTPNERSSHVVPTPSGGGIGIAAAGTLIGLVLAGWSEGYLLTAVAVGAMAAVMGLLDDRFDLSSRLRLAAQFVLVGILLVAVGALPPILTPIGALPQGLLYAMLGLTGVWWFNLFNFMDGIDGLATTEAMFILGGAVILSAQSQAPIGNGPTLWWIVAVVAACAGFLMHNWPPARIFMGDAGSNYVAVTIFTIALLTIANGWLGYPAWIILVASFVADATVTLVGRILARQRWFAAHRLHAYQKLSRRWKTHGKVTVLYIAINAVWLYPLAYWAQAQPDTAWWAVIVAYAPLVGFCALAGAGRPDKSATESRILQP